MAPCMALVLGVCLLMMACGHAGRLTQAAPDLRTASDQGDLERRARIRLELASAYFAQGRLETSLDELKQALTLYPDLADALSLRGLVYAGLQQFALAEDSFDRALRLAPHDPYILHNQGWFLCQRGRHDAAQGAFDRALAQPLYPEATKSWLAKGVCQSMAGQSDAAVRTLTWAFDRDPASPVTAFNLAAVLADQGRDEQAARYIRLLNQQPNWVNAQSLWLGARIESRLGRSEAAADLISQLRRQFPLAPESRASLRGAADE